MITPYQEVWSAGLRIRTFFESVDDAELIWHRDRRTRYVKVLEGEGWKLQFDNQLPIELTKGKHYQIEAETYHRILKGTTNLILEIRED